MTWRPGRGPGGGVGVRRYEPKNPNQVVSDLGFWFDGLGWGIKKSLENLLLLLLPQPLEAHHVG